MMINLDMGVCGLFKNSSEFSKGRRKEIDRKTYKEFLSENMRGVKKRRLLVVER